MERYPFRAATQEDLGPLTELFAVSDPVDFGQVLWGSSDIEHFWHRARFDITRDSWVATARDGRAAAYGFVWVREPWSYVIATGVVHPEHRGRGIGSRLVDAMEERARELCVAAPPEVTPIVNAAVPAEDTAAIELLQAHGYSEARRFWQMERPLDGSIAIPPDPDGITIVAAFDHDAPEIHGVIQDAFRDHWRPRYEPFEEWEARNLRDQVRFWFLARAGEEPAGAITSYVEEDDGHVDQIGVRAPWRRRGVGEALLWRAFAALEGSGATNVALDVDSENPTGATGLYERVGMRATVSYCFFDKALR